jgi:prepilin-type N-terminal cleavage/methylation domain-containing protein
MSRHDARGSAGFTLTETLVVVAILSLLATLVVPTFHIVFKYVNGSVCGNNLRELHRGMMIYELEHGRLPMWHKNFGEYARSHNIYENIWQGHGNQLRPLGFQGLGMLVGYNPSWIGANFYSWPPDWNNSPEAQINQYKSSGGASGKAPWKTMKYVAMPSVFYCPEMKLGYQTGWSSYLKWTKDWSAWPNGPDGSGYTYATYAVRPGTRIEWNIPNDRGLCRSRSDSNIWPSKEFGMTTPGNIFAGQAVLSDCNSLKVYVPNCHGTGVNVAYRDGSVAFVEDDGTMTEENLTVLSDAWVADGATKLVNIWTLYDDRYNP